MSRVLLVADTPWVRNDVLAALNDSTIELETVSDPKAVNDAYRDLPADVVLVDLQVGSMGGMAIARALKDMTLIEGLPAAPIVLLLDRSADSFIAKRSGADGWVQKPFTAQELRSKITEVSVNQSAR